MVKRRPEESTPQRTIILARQNSWVSCIIREELQPPEVCRQLARGPRRNCLQGRVPEHQGHEQLELPGRQLHRRENRPGPLRERRPAVIAFPSLPALPAPSVSPRPERSASRAWSSHKKNLLCLDSGWPRTGGYRQTTLQRGHAEPGCLAKTL
jgi:hypothetical protein